MPGGNRSPWDYETGWGAAAWSEWKGRGGGGKPAEIRDDKIGAANSHMQSREPTVAARFHGDTRRQLLAGLNCSHWTNWMTVAARAGPKERLKWCGWCGLVMAKGLVTCRSTSNLCLDCNTSYSPSRTRSWRTRVQNGVLARCLRYPAAWSKSWQRAKIPTESRNELHNIFFEHDLCRANLWLNKTHKRATKVASNEGPILPIRDRRN